MKNNKIYDCITFFRENFITNIRFEVLKNVVDYFVVCESIYDHKKNKKKLNFKLLNAIFKKKLIYIVLDHQFPSNLDIWGRQAYQREYIFKGLTGANQDDYIMYSDPDEIPNPRSIVELDLKKKFGIFLQKHFVYKFNILNNYDSPWAGTRVTRMKDLKSFDYMRHKVLLKNLKKWWRPDKEKSVELIDNGGWHFNNLFSAKELSIKLKTFAHEEFAADKYSSIDIIKKKIEKKKDLFNRGQTFEKVDLDNSFPEYIFKNQKKFKKFID
jgi:beta-1,4-mannosyl-glycoprotein beta-1,4-N-acetylglucosaminyltransferase